MSDINTINDSLIGSTGNTVIAAVPLRLTTRQAAFRAVAWILAMAPILPEEDPASSLEDVCRAIENT